MHSSYIRQKNSIIELNVICNAIILDYTAYALETEDGGKVHMKKYNTLPVYLRHREITWQPFLSL
jgi:hypothetical protein